MPRQTIRVAKLSPKAFKASWPWLLGWGMGLLLAAALSASLSYGQRQQPPSPAALKLKWQGSNPVSNSATVAQPSAEAPLGGATPAQPPEPAPPVENVKQEEARPTRAVPSVTPSLAADATLPLRQDRWSTDRPALAPERPHKTQAPPSPLPRIEDVDLLKELEALKEKKDEQPSAPPMPELPAIAEQGSPSDGAQLSGSRQIEDGAEIKEGTFKLLGVEKPGGDVLVLGVLVNDLGVTEQVVIVVPSKYSLGDIGLMLGHQKKTWPDIVPPILPGEKRWLELRFDHKGVDPNLTGPLP